MANPELIVCPTTGLRESLSASIFGIVENAAAYNHRPRIFIAVDSTKPEAEHRARSVLYEITRALSLSGFLTLPASRTSFLANLESRFDPDILQYAWQPSAGYSSFGAVSNTVLLSTSGSRIATIDDDVYCRPGVRESYSKEIQYSSTYHPADLYYYLNRTSLLNAVEEAPVDVLSEHGRFLGERSNNVAWTTKPDADVPGGSVLMSMSGSYGESGMRSARSFLSVEGPCRDALFTSSETYNAHKLSNELIRIPGSITVGPGVHCSAMQLGLSNDRLLPPFLPEGRNQEGLFTVLLRIIYPKSLTAFLNFGLYHNPTGDRVHTKKDLIEFHPTLPEIIMAPLVFFRPSRKIVEPMERMNILGKHLEEFSRLKLGDFTEELHNIWSSGVNLYVERLENLLDTFNREPQAWSEDIEDHLEYIFKMLRDPKLLFGHYGCRYTAEQVRFHTRMFGKLLQIWPDLHSVSAEMNGEHRGLAHEVLP